MEMSTSLADVAAERSMRPEQPRAVRSGQPDVECELLTQQLGAQYQVVRTLGRGGMGVVYLARDLALHRMVAIKVLRHDLVQSEEDRERFRREARMTARLSHPNIVPVHAFGETRDLVYFVMKYVDGESLAERLRRETRIPATETRRLLAEIALALDYAHGEGVVHRDLKAENIILERATGRPVLTDFGVALFRSSDHAPADARRAFGTPHYMSPEQAAGELDLDGRSDLYALGVLGYAMLSGTLPFDGASVEAIVAKHLTEQPAPLDTAARHAPCDLVAAIERCLAKERAARWRHGRDLHEALTTGRHGVWASPRLASLRGAVRSRTTAALDVLAAALCL